MTFTKFSNSMAVKLTRTDRDLGRALDMVISGCCSYYKQPRNAQAKISPLGGHRHGCLQQQQCLMQAYSQGPVPLLLLGGRAKSTETVPSKQKRIPLEVF